MKAKIWLWLWLGIGSLIACEDETRENPPFKGSFFVQANPWKFYFLDGQGKSLVRLVPGAVLPTTMIGTVDEPKIVPDEYHASNPYLSYGNNYIGYDEEKKLPYWMTSVPGHYWAVESQFYVMFNRTDVDTVRVRFKFTPGGAVGGSGIDVDVLEMYYNNLLVIKNGDYISREGIWLQKQDGKTSLWEGKEE